MNSLWKLSKREKQAKLESKDMVYTDEYLKATKDISKTLQIHYLKYLSVLNPKTLQILNAQRIIILFGSSECLEKALLKHPFICRYVPDIKDTIKKIKKSEALLKKEGWHVIFDKQKKEWIQREIPTNKEHRPTDFFRYIVQLLLDNSNITRNTKQARIMLRKSLFPFFPQPWIDTKQGSKLFYTVRNCLNKSSTRS